MLTGSDPDSFGDRANRCAAQDVNQNMTSMGHDFTRKNRSIQCVDLEPLVVLFF